MRLGINIDHVATIRNARGGKHPDPLNAALIAEKAGADLIVAHLREDRRHIKEDDLDNILAKINIPLQLEIAPTLEMFNYVMKKRIKKVCIVPERREELTTEGGMDIEKNRDFLSKNLPTFLSSNIEVSIFIDPNFSSIRLCEELGVKAIELHTGSFANADTNNELFELEKISRASDFASKSNFSVRAGHGLNYEKVKKIIKISKIEELNIGHFIIGESIFKGLDNVIKEMRNIISEKK